MRWQNFLIWDYWLADDGIRIWNLSNGKMLANFLTTQTSRIVALPNGSLATADNVYSDFSIWDVKGCV